MVFFNNTPDFPSQPIDFGKGAVVVYKDNYYKQQGEGCNSIRFAGKERTASADDPSAKIFAIGRDTINTGNSIVSPINVAITHESDYLVVSLLRKSPFNAEYAAICNFKLVM
ncbi:MAG TPA: hypothetical protein VKR58_08580 [Aquella sp.]|nr:hypothetical protein [Aquella sp.]